MKKLILAIAIVAGGFSTFASTINPIQNEMISVSIKQEFKEITLESLPAEVTATIAKDFTSATLNKAYVNIKQQYKLEITIDGTDNVVYIDKDGNWLKASDVEVTEE
ncbi:hypothetical protein [Algibacter sp. L4_22]|uniref:hypothetical protein n=1 Tax=Algibacter sp. L4_22 TaxID=2942477 RepID=UPI00201B6839|nr:hypothetical protein [Algibacter sp. L4_22]MCL5127214.1 hypothetical protein [Algibacter sp. L4_22]